jgi:phage shock protein A
MDTAIIELQQKIEDLTKLNAELMANKQEYASAKQSINRMSVRLRKLCKRLTPTNEIVFEMQKIAGEICEYVKKV